MFFFFFDAAGRAREQRLQVPHLGRAIEFVDAVREVDGALSVGALGTLLHVVEHLPELATGDITLRDLAQKLNVAPTSLARQLDALADGGPGGGGLELLEKALHPDDKRKRQIVLTNRGMALLGRLSAIMGPGDACGDEGAEPGKAPDLAGEISQRLVGKSDPEIP
jgi:DNA-binding MarR family transcriptional regulator